MPTPLTPLNALWRSALASPPDAVDDRELIRQHCGWGGHYEAMEILTQRMNEVAEGYAPTVTAIQGWLDKIQILELDHGDAVEAGTADGQRRAEISMLRFRILDALALDEQAVTNGGFGYSGLVRS